MTTDLLQYDKMVENALKGVVRTALKEVQQHGLPENHHFYITFKTKDEGVRVPEYLADKYQGEMTIVLQYQFYNLEVNEKLFSVSLSFNNVTEDLVIPFAAITGFADPSVKFGLQFQNSDMADFDDLMDDDQDELQLAPADILSLAEMVEEATEELQKEKSSMKSKRITSKSAAPEEKETGDKVISLDTFRKK